MKQLATFVGALVIVATSLTPIPEGTPARSAMPARALPEGTARIVSSDPHAASLVRRAMESFASAGLRLPPLTVVVHDDGAAACGGAPGRYSVEGKRRRIHLCSRLYFVVLHELAHAWEDAAIDETTRLAYLERIGLRVWNSGEVPRSERGVERAANVIAWSLLASRLSASERLEYAEWLDQFELLTGVVSPRRYGVVDEVREAFAEAGLNVPDAEIRLWTTPEACGGHLGMHRREAGGDHRIDICVHHDNPVVEEALLRRAIAHEMAHVWISEHVDAPSRAAFMDLRRLEVWADPDVEWARRGAEQAAEIVRWGVEGGTEALWQLDDPGCADLRTAFILLTGRSIGC